MDNFFNMQKPILNEKLIKCRLIDYLLQHYPVKLLGVEVPFLSGKRWVDVLLITDTNRVIAFEIKSELDTLKRINAQLKDYTKTFDQVYVIFAEKFSKIKAAKTLARNVGYGVINPQGTQIKIKRKPRTRNRLSKKNLTYFLWRKDLQKPKAARLTSEDLRRSLEKTTSLDELHKKAINALITRYQERYALFLREKSSYTQIDELECLTKTFLDVC